MLKFPVSWSSFSLSDRKSSSKPVRILHHGIDRKVLLDTIATGTTIDFRNSSEGPNCFSHVINQKTGLRVLDDLSARAEVHRDNGHARGIGFDEDKSESLLDSV